jgi:heat shock protein HslJ
MRRRSLAALVALAGLVAACSPGPGDGGELQGTDWVLRAYDQGGTLTIAPETQYADADFAANRVRGFSGCNDYDAVYRAGGRTLFVSTPSVTLRACPEEQMAFEQAYLQLLDKSRFYSAGRSTLTVFGADRTTLLVYDAAPRNPLRGLWQVDSYATAPNTVSAVLPGTRLDVVFGLVSVGGSAGCNSFSGTYGTNGNVVRISQLATTRVACEPDVMDQETKFLTALQGAALIETRPGQVNLTDLRGSLLVALVRPATEAPAASPSPGRSPTASPSAAAPSEAATPTPAPTPSPATPAPTPPAQSAPAPSAQPSAGPSLPPPSVLPTITSCNLVTADGVNVAVIVYPKTWSTLTEPPELACRYFDPEPITVPADPASLETDVRASTEATPFADAKAAAIDPAAWNVRKTVDLTLDNLPAIAVEAEATTDAAGVPVGTSRFAYLIDLGAVGTVTIWTTGAPDDPAYPARAALVTLMTGMSVFQAPS